MRRQTLRSFLTTLAEFFRPRPRAAITRAATTLVAPSSASAQLSPPAEVPQVQQLIGKVTALTSTVAEDVGQHNANILNLSAELSAVAQSDPTAVAAIVCKLLVANRELQGRLQNAEDSLKDHSQQLKAAV